MSDLRIRLPPLFLLILTVALSGLFLPVGAIAGPSGDDDDSAGDDDDSAGDDTDADEDGWTVGEGDCNDANNTINPGVKDGCDDDVDQNCDGHLEMSSDDRDGDGQGPDGDNCECDDCGEGYNQDCDDTDPVLNNYDLDGDNWMPCSHSGGDCDDNDPDINPDGTEVCADGADNDCSGEADDLDADGDGFVSPDCGGDDCDDSTATTNPEAEEADATCEDEVDNDCDGTLDQDDEDCKVEPSVDAGVDQQDRYLGNWLVMAFDGSGSADLNPADVLTYTWTVTEGAGDFSGTTHELITSPDSPLAYLRFHADQGAAGDQWEYNVNLIVGDGTFTTDPELPEANLVATIFRPTAFQQVGCALVTPVVPGLLVLLSFGFGALLRRRRL